jgi:hypothetical protein
MAVEFQQRVKTVLHVNRSVVFVPCGALADKFLSWCKLPETSRPPWRAVEVLLDWVEESVLLPASRVCAWRNLV